MKIKNLKIAAVFILLLFTSSTIKAQASKDIKDVALMKEGNKTQGVVLGDGTAKAIQVLGQPNSITDYYSEMDDETLKVYNYGNNKLYFNKGALDSYELSQGGILIGAINGDAYNVGEKIVTNVERIYIGPPEDGRYNEQITKYFHNYNLVNGQGGKSRGVTYKAISNHYLKNGTKVLDMFIQLLFDANENLINAAIVTP